MASQEIICQGPFSTVLRGRWKDHEGLVAIKKARRTKKYAPHDIDYEATILGMANHDGVVRLLDSSIEGSMRLLVLEYYPFSLEERVIGVSEDVCQACIRQISDAIMYIHALGIIHRDIKPSNIMVNEQFSKFTLIDFGIAWCASVNLDERANEKILDVGTNGYKAPELLFGQTDYSASIDLWAWGCTIARFYTKDNVRLFGDPFGDLPYLATLLKTLGTPQKESWPESSQMPDFEKVTLKPFSPMPWETLLPDATQRDILVVRNLLQYSASKRMLPS
jgi:cyclin-dependent kinase